MCNFATPGNVGHSQQSKKIQLSEVVDLLDESEITESIDLGGAVVHRLKHPISGNLIIVNGTGADSAVLYV